MLQQALDDAIYFLSRQWVGSMDVDRLLKTIDTLASHSKSLSSRKHCTCNGHAQALAEKHKEGIR